MTTFAEWATEAGIRMRIRQVPDRPDGMMDALARHFVVRLARRDAGYPERAMTLYYSQGSAYTEPPTLAEVLESLQMDYTCVTFEDWCHEYGYDDDSRRAERTYRACRKASRAMERVFGPFLGAFLEVEA